MATEGDATALAALRARLLEPQGSDNASVDEVCALVARLRDVHEPVASDESLVLLAAIALLAHGNHAAQTAAVEMSVLSLMEAMKLDDRVQLAATLLLMIDNEAVLDIISESGVARRFVASLDANPSSVVALALQGLQVLTEDRPAVQLECVNASAVLPLCNLFAYSYGGYFKAAMGVLKNLVENAAIDGEITNYEKARLQRAMPGLSLCQQKPVSTALAVSILKRVVAQSDHSADPLHSLLDELRRSDSDRYTTRVALEELGALISTYDAATLQAAVDDELVSVCLAQLTGARSRAVQHAAGMVLGDALVQHPCLHAAVRKAIPLEQLVGQLKGDNLAAVFVLGPLLADDACVEAVAAGAVRALVSVLHDGDVAHKHVAARALSELLTLNDAVREEALTAGVIQPLLDFLPDTLGNNCDDMLLPIERLVSRSNSTYLAARAVFLRAQGDEHLVHTMAMVTEDTERTAALNLMLAMVTDDESSQEAFVGAGAVLVLTRLLLQNENNPCSPTVAQLLGCFAENNANVKIAIVYHGQALPRLVQLLQSERGDHVVSAAYALGRIAMDDATAQKAVAAAGGVEALVQVVETGAEDEARSASVALDAVVDNHKEIQEDRAAPARHIGATSWLAKKLSGLFVKSPPSGSSSEDAAPHTS